MAQNGHEIGRCTQTRWDGSLDLPELTSAQATVISVMEDQAECGLRWTITISKLMELT